MNGEYDPAVLANELKHINAQLSELKNDVALLKGAYQQAQGARWMLSLLKGTGLIGLGTGLVKVVEWLSSHPS